MSTSGSRPRLPDGTHYAVTTGFDPGFKGMTTAMLSRSRAFVEQTGRPVTILTHNGADYDHVRDDLVARGFLIEGMSLINMFEDIRTWDDDTARRNLGSDLAGSDIPGDLLATDDADVAVERYRRTKQIDGRILQVDHLRDDGSVFMSERRIGERTYVHFDRQGSPTVAVVSEAELLVRWIDTLPRDPMAWLIIDSRVSARLLLDYQRPDVARIHVLHYSHVMQRGTTAQLKRSSSPILERMDDLDAIVFLTDAQRRDLDPHYGPGTGNRFSVPNVCEVPEVRDVSVFSERRDRRRGVMVARFDKGKRVDYAIRAIASASDTLDPRRRPTLDVYGGGSRRKHLEAEIEKVSARRRTLLGRVVSRLGYRRTLPIRLHGHEPHAREEFWTASFSLLTSRSEGSPLVIVESMARGAIPICFDIKFGPGEIVTDGVDGFLIPFTARRQAEQDLAAAIHRIVSMSHAELSAMRAAAHRRAQDFGAASVTRRWIDVMTEIGERKHRVAAGTSDQSA